jgi:outer membrane protein TolC
MKTLIIFQILILCAVRMHAQPNTLSADQAIELALKNNARIHGVALELEAQEQLRKTSFDLPKTEFIFQYGQTNSYARDNNLLVTQNIPFTAFGSQASLNRSLVGSARLKKEIAGHELAYMVKQTYYQLAWSQAHLDLLKQQDTIYEGFLKSATLRFQVGESKLLEKTTAEVQRSEVQNSLHQTEADILVLKTRLQALLNIDFLPDIDRAPLAELTLKHGVDTGARVANPSLAYSQNQILVAKAQRKLETAKAAPDLLVGIFSQTMVGTFDPETGNVSTKSDRFTGIEVGLSIPLWFVPAHGRARSAALQLLASEKNYENDQKRFQGELQQALQQYTKFKSSLEYYLASALPNADLILKQSQTAFKEGEIAYSEYLMAVRQAIAIKESYLRTVNDYNQSIIYIEYLSGNK